MAHLSSTDRKRFTTLRTRHAIRHNADFSDDDFVELLTDAKAVLTEEVQEQLTTSGSLSFDGEALNALLDSYLSFRMGHALQNGGSPRNRLRDGSTPRRVSEIRRMEVDSSMLSFDQTRLVAALNKVTDGN